MLSAHWTRQATTGRAVELAPGKTSSTRTGARLLTWQTKELLERETERRGIAVLVRPELVVEIALDGVQSSTRYPGGVALRFARVKRYRPDKDAREADTIDDLRALLPARVGDEFQSSEPSEEVPNPNDEHPEEER